MNDPAQQDQADTPGPASPGRRAWQRFRANRAALVSGCVLLGLLGLVGSSGGWMPYEPNALSEAQLAPPSWQHWCGTDANGRDVFARMCAGARVSLIVGLSGALVSLVIGVLWGGVAGWVGGRIDAVMMRTVDVLYALPSIIFVIVLVTVAQAPLKVVLTRLAGDAGADAAELIFLIIGLGAVSWLNMARIVRGQVMALRSRTFVDAARVLGAGPARILWKHILPNTSGVIVVYLTLTIPAVVLGESFLSYLGLGIQAPRASLGSLLADGASQINPMQSSGWLLFGPASLLVGLLLAFSFVGDGLRDALDPEADR